MELTKLSLDGKTTNLFTVYCRLLVRNCEEKTSSDGPFIRSGPTLGVDDAPGFCPFCLRKGRNISLSVLPNGTAVDDDTEDDVGVVFNCFLFFKR
jgi:hypothetical protein